MSTNLKRMTVTFLPEWDEDLDRLKKEQFYDKSKSELIRYLIQQGLEKVKNDKRTRIE